MTRMRQQIQLQVAWKELNPQKTLKLTAKPVNSAEGEALYLQRRAELAWSTY